MADVIVSASLAETVADLDKSLGLPWRGYRFGSGPWPEISDTPGGPGWTVHWRRDEPHAEGADRELEIDAALEALPAWLRASGAPGATGRATALEARLAAREAKAAPLPLEAIEAEAKPKKA